MMSLQFDLVPGKTAVNMFSLSVLLPAVLITVINNHFIDRVKVLLKHYSFGVFEQ